MSNDICTYETAWCPGCGNFAILDCLKTVLNEMGKSPEEVLVAAGIGQAAKTPQYISANSFCGLHGRSLPAAISAKIANPGLTVIVDTGDGDSYGEGGNHFLHNIRRNVDINHFVHDNQIYGLTKGQASPTTLKGMVTPVQVFGSMHEPLNPVLVAIAAGAGFVARSFSGDKEHLQEMMRRAINYPGYALIDILQPCVSFNKLNTYQYYKNKVYYLEEGYNPSDKQAAMAKAMETEDRIPLGVLYYEEKETFHQKHRVLAQGTDLSSYRRPLELTYEIAREFE
jgi:2-oxoacid:acceptor oxidoreductase, beta subunit, pyruvate/2-ketoisovalerate family